MFITQSYFSVPKGVKLNSTHYLIMKINNRKELENIAINILADIYYNDFARIYRECTRRAYSFLTIDTTLPASDSLRLRKNCFLLTKMTVADQINILDKKVMQNESQYDLDRKAAKISALPSNIFDKYEYLTGEDLDLKTSTAEQARFDYSPLSKFLNKDLKEEEKGEGPLKILKNIEDKNKKQLKSIEDQGKNN